MARKWLGAKEIDEYTSSTGGVSNVAYDATGAGGAATSGTNSVNITWSHTASGSNRAVFVALMVGGVSAAASTFTRTVTYGGVAMTSFGVQDGATNGWVEVFGLAAPATGAQTVSVTVSKAATSFGRVLANSFSYTNVGDTRGVIMSSFTASTNAWMVTPNTWSGNMAGSTILHIAAVDSSATISRFISANNYFTTSSTIPPMQDTSIRWSNNSTAGTGMTSVSVSEMPGAMHSSMHVFPSVASHMAGLTLAITPVGTPVPPGIRGVWLTMIGAGGGGGSGRQGASATARYGGTGGGGGGMVVDRYIPASVLGSTYNLYVPPQAGGGAGQTTATTDGNYGKRSGDVLFGSDTITISCGSGHGGFGGGTAAPATTIWGGLTGDSFGYGGAGGAGSNTVGSPGYFALSGNGYSCAGGGGGGGIGTGNVVSGGGAGGSINEMSLAGGAGGVVGTSSPGVGSATTIGITGGAAGGGGAHATTPQAGASATAYGAGGGGGGASLNGNTSGAGGNGGPAYVRIMWDYK